MSIDNQLGIIKRLKAARAKIIDPATWCREALYKNAEGEAARDPSTACSFCSMGAFVAVGGRPISGDGWGYVGKAAKVFGSSAVFVNDNKTHDEVIEMWNGAIKLAEADLIILNLERLIKAVEAQPDDAFNLRFYADKKIYGTFYCTVGLAACIPEFKLQGYELIWRENSTAIVTVRGNPAGYAETDQDFGADSYDLLFTTRGWSAFDSDFEVAGEDGPSLPGQDFLTDKTLALHRLNKQLAIYKERK